MTPCSAQEERTRPGRRRGLRRDRPSAPAAAEGVAGPAACPVRRKAEYGTGPHLRLPPRARRVGRRLCAKLKKMQTRSGDFELTMDELRAIAVYAVACAEPALVLFQKARPDDPRPAAALHAARVFAEGAPRSRLQRTAAADADRAARDATTEVARHAASAAGDAAAAAYLHPLAKATQVRHILGSAAHAARAAELARDDDPVVAEYVITAAAKRATPVVLDVLTRYPRAPKGRSRVAVLMERLDSLLRDPPPTPRVVDDPG